ncbi:MAG TPA: NADH-quinone oxidoreductase subunit NuoE [Nitrospiria bacterium]
MEATPEKTEFSEKTQKKIEELLTHYPVKRSALIPILSLAQEEFGYISEGTMVRIAEILDLTPPQVYEVMTFYTMLERKPVGKFRLQVCRTLSCALAGAPGIVEHLKKRLGIGVGETTPDGLFTLQTVECLAACGTAPAVQINGAYFENLTTEKVDRILEDLKKGVRPVPKGIGEN